MWWEDQPDVVQFTEVIEESGNSVQVQLRSDLERESNLMKMNAWAGFSEFGHVLRLVTDKLWLFKLRLNNDTRVSGFICTFQSHGAKVGDHLWPFIFGAKPCLHSVEENFDASSHRFDKCTRWEQVRDRRHMMTLKQIDWHFPGAHSLIERLSCLMKGSIPVINRIEYKCRWHWEGLATSYILETNISRWRTATAAFAAECAASVTPCQVSASRKNLLVALGHSKGVLSHSAASVDISEMSCCLWAICEVSVTLMG